MGIARRNGEMNFFKNLFAGGPRIKRTDITKRFLLQSRVGQGSMSKVWRATDTNTGRTVALKVLDKEKTKKLEDRFKGLKKPTEGEIAVQLRHPNIVQTFEHGHTRDREQFLVMEFIEGVSLSYLVDVQNDVMLANRLKFMIELGEAINYFHRQNWIHRDICPRNVLVTPENQIKLIDFGLVVPNTPDFRKPGNRTGTANYMAPELVRRQSTDQRIDIYSYAITCYEMWTKRFPWEVGSSEAVMLRVNQPPADIREHAEGIDHEIAEIIMRGLETQPADRWPSMSKLLEALEEANQRLNPGSRRTAQT
jgi:eukaryotic-like serine/threonine-protein kinase